MPTTEPGLYVHSKTGNKYRVLFEAEWLDGTNPWPDQVLGVYGVSGFASDRCRIAIWPLSHTAHEPFLLVKWSGNESHAAFNEPLVVYVALYGDGRVSVRPVKEFNEIVTIDGKDVRRFVRVGD